MSNSVYAVTNEYIASDEFPMTANEASDYISDMDFDDGWDYQVEESGNQLRLYAYRDDAESYEPLNFDGWNEVNSDIFYMVMGVELVNHLLALIEDDMGLTGEYGGGDYHFIVISDEFDSRYSIYYYQNSTDIPIDSDTRLTISQVSDELISLNSNTNTWGLIGIN